MSGSLTLNVVEQATPETWRQYYNGPHAGFIDVALALKECPWLVGHGAGITLTLPAELTINDGDANA
jgi:hypothetical protein